MSTFDCPPTKEALLNALAADIPAKASQRCCDEYVHGFWKNAEQAASDGLHELSAAFQLLRRVSSLHLKPEDANAPFHPCLVTPTGRSPSLEDFTDSEIQLFADTASDATDFDLKARLADVSWIRLRHHQMARMAVHAYVDSAKHILTAPFPSSVIERLERAAQIASMLGKDQTPIEVVRNALMEIVSEESQIRPIVADGMDLLFKYARTEAAVLAPIAERRATDSRPSNSLIWQQRFWDITARFYYQSKQTDHGRRAQIEVALTIERQAEQHLEKPSVPSYLAAASFFEKAIQAYRRIPGTEAERHRVQLRLVECQAQAASEWKSTFVGSTDLTEIAERARHSVAGKPFEDALRQLALALKSPDLAKLRAEAIASIDAHPFAFLFEGSSLSPTGKVVAKHGSTSSTGDDRESLILREMWTSARLHQQICVVGQIEPMRRQILLEHHVRLADFQNLVTYNPLVPPGRERLFAMGLHAGLHGNFVEALHILIPQLEYSLRCILQELGILVSSLDPRGIQKEHDLNSMLYEPRLVEVFPDDIVFELRWLLVEQSGANMRNQLAHGMLNYGAFLSETAIYIWWFILHLCTLPSMQASQRGERKD